MKILHTVFLMSLFSGITKEEKAQTMDSTIFRSERVTRTATIILNGTVKDVFPLFGAFEERKWTEGWNPTLIYPDTETIAEGTTFKTPGHMHNEKEYLWRVSKYLPSIFSIQYTVYSPNRVWTIMVNCNTIPGNKTSAEITYDFVGLNEIGNELDKHSINIMYKDNLKDWEESINSYLKPNNRKK